LTNDRSYAIQAFVIRAINPGARRAAELAGQRGSDTRRRILDEAFALATSEGLEGLTIGKLSSSMRMSKAGVFAHFGSKEELQLATVDLARERWIDEIVRPAITKPRGLARLVAMCERWMEYAIRREGGCFFAAASAEFDGRPGPVRDRIASSMRDWLDTLGKSIEMAIAEGHLRADVEPAQLAFEIHGLELGANWARQLLSDERATERAIEGVRTRLLAAATDGGRRVLEDHDANRTS
jgi:AcrR family transcriptional regulator